MDTLPAVSPLTTFSEKELLSFLLNKAQEREAPVALWRLPASGQTHLIIADDYYTLEPGALLEEMDPGFLMAPFDKDKSRYFLPADRLFTFENGRLKTDEGNLEEVSIRFLGDGPLGAFRTKPFVVRDMPPPASHEQEKESFIAVIQQSVKAIENGRFEKIVPSRTRTVALSTSFSVVDSFQKLCGSYPDALISFVSIPGVGCSLGATPEVLVRVEDRSIFKTVALAGTLPYSSGVDIRSVAWTQKEIEEQALVERYIISCFKKIRLREYHEQGPKTVVAGNLMHLKSEFTVDMKATNFPQIGSVMLDLLHPTSAVCGMPLDAALQFLKECEHYDRGFYAGYLGPVQVHDSIALFVNLRCMQISGNTGTLYAGAGVTLDSVPEKEWHETEMKLDTLLKVIF